MFYLEHVCAVVMAILHHHSLVTGQCERDAVLPSAVDRLQHESSNKQHKHATTFIFTAENKINSFSLVKR